MPDRSDRIQEAKESSAENELSYLSKSRVKSWLSNPRHFYFKYVKGLKAAETEPMVRGTQIHELFEDYYNELKEVYESSGTLPALTERVSWFGDWYDLGRHSEPYVSNFLTFENRRLEEAGGLDDYAPISIEEEHWISPQLGLDKEPSWMGLADVIVPAASLSEIESDTGVVVIDFKTGKVPKQQYRSDDGGIYTELEYYAILFGDKYDVVGAAAYYPKADELLVQPDKAEYRENVEQAVREMVPAVASLDKSEFEKNEGPLCKWSEDPDDESEYYGLCNCTWGKPAKNKERFTKLVERGLHDSGVADKLGTSTEAVRYWAWKFDLK